MVAGRSFGKEDEGAGGKSIPDLVHNSAALIGFTQKKLLIFSLPISATRRRNNPEQSTIWDPTGNFHAPGSAATILNS
jgi:hypothetical protein